MLRWPPDIAARNPTTSDNAEPSQAFKMGFKPSDDGPPFPGRKPPARTTREAVQPKDCPRRPPPAPQAGALRPTVQRPPPTQDTVLPSIEIDGDDLEAWYESVDRKRRRMEEEEEENPPNPERTRLVKRLRAALVAAGIPQPRGPAGPTPEPERGEFAREEAGGGA